MLEIESGHTSVIFYDADSTEFNFSYGVANSIGGLPYRNAIQMMLFPKGNKKVLLQSQKL